MEPTDAAVLMLILWLGAVMLVHGVRHARTVDGTASWFSSQWSRYPRQKAQARQLARSPSAST